MTYRPPIAVRRKSAVVSADSFDLDLFRLIERADHFAKSAETRLNKDRWEYVRDTLRQARPTVRDMMSVADRARTA